MSRPYIRIRSKRNLHAEASQLRTEKKMPKTSKTHSSSKRILSVTIKRMLDDSPDTSYLGEYANIPTSEFSIDRASDAFVGDIEAGEDWLQRIGDHIEEALSEMPCDCADRSWYGKEHDSACPSYPDNAWYLALDSAQDTVCESILEFVVDWNRREYRYFNPSFNYVDKHGKLAEGNTAEEVRKYVRQDYERMERLYRGDWHYMGIRAEAEIVILSGKMGATSQTISSGGLWGIESDSGNDYLQSIEQEELSELRAQLKELGFSARAISAAFKNVEREEN